MERGKCHGEVQEILCGNTAIVELPVHFNCISTIEASTGRQKHVGHGKVGKKRSLLKLDLSADLIRVEMLPREFRVLNVVLHFLGFSKALKTALPDVFGSKLGLL